MITKSNFFKFGAVVNTLLFLVIYAGCSGFWGCSQPAKGYFLLLAIINMPVSLVIGQFSVSLVTKAFLIAVAGTYLNTWILGAIFRKRRKQTLATGAEQPVDTAPGKKGE